MKKILLLSSIMLLSAISTHAINWKPLSVVTPNIDVYYDADALKIVNNYEYYYIIRYQALGQSEKIAYIKVDAKTKRIGIIQAGEYEPGNYRPNAVFETAHAFMKPVKEDSFLYYANDEIAKIVNGYTFAEVQKGFVPVAYRSSRDAKSVMISVAYRNYMETACKLLKNNWNAPKPFVGKKTVIKATIGVDGSLQGYNIIESSNDDKNDRSVISALERTVLYPLYITKDSNIDALDFQFIFENNTFKKSVVY